jgi:hypothetical protein
MYDVVRGLAPIPVRRDYAAGWQKRTIKTYASRLVWAGAQCAIKFAGALREPEPPPRDAQGNRRATRNRPCLEALSGTG